MTSIESDHFPRPKGLDCIVAETRFEISDGLLTRTMTAVKPEVRCPDVIRKIRSLFQYGFTGVAQMQATDHGQQFFFRKRFMNRFQDIGVACMRTCLLYTSRCV